VITLRSAFVHSHRRFRVRGVYSQGFCWCLLVSLVLLVKALTVVRGNLMFLVFILIYGAGSDGRLVSSGFWGSSPARAYVYAEIFSV